MKKILFIFISFIVFLPNVIAEEECTYTEINRLRNLASLIKFEVKYIGESSEDEYGIYVSNMSEEFYININGRYYFSNTIVKNLNSKKTYTIGIALLNNPCSSKFKYAKTINIPAYNIYYNSSYCDEYKDIELCQIDYDSSKLTEEQFKIKIEEYMQSQTQDDVQFEKIENKNKLFIIIGIAVMFLIIVLGIINSIKKRKKHLL